MTKQGALSLGQLVRQKREDRGLSMRQLALAIGTQDTTIMRIETGQTANPRGELLRAIAEALELSSADLFAAAGYALPAELPSFRPYLRAKYQALPPEAIARLEQTFADIAEQYGTDGPADGEDEQ